MKTIILAFMTTAVLLAQVAQREGPRVWASGPFAQLPINPVTGTVFIVTDASAAGICDASGGTAKSTCRWSGSAWESIGGGGGISQATMFSGGTTLLRLSECAYGSVPYTSLTTAATNQEITIQTGMAGSARYDHTLVSETTQFALGALPSDLVVSMGRTGANNYELTGTNVALLQSSGDANFWISRPPPPQVASTYDIVLNFATNPYYTTGTVSATNGSTAITGSGTTWTSAMTGMMVQISGEWYGFTYLSATTATLGSNFTGATSGGLNHIVQAFVNSASAGSLTWEICGYKAR